MTNSGFLPVKYAVIDAFTESAFKGNPAAVCVLEEERDDSWLQSVATEFKLSQTGFLTRLKPSSSSSSIPTFNLRWFTPVSEVKLCGHATLAAAHLCFTSGLVTGNVVEFSTLSGTLTATKKESAVTMDSKADHHPFSIELDFPAVFVADYNSADEISLLSEVLDHAPIVDIKKSTFDDIFVVLPSVAAVADLQPQIEKIRKLSGRGLIISSLGEPGSEFDFVSRFFCPKQDINEDPVCGSAHCALALYWSEKLGKRDFLAYAASPRSGIVKLHLDEHKRVHLEGTAVIIMEGSILV